MIFRSAAFGFTFLCFCLFIAKFASAQNYDDAKKLRIDPDAAMGGTVSQYIDKVKFFTFESSPESAFGNINQVEITDQYFIILDRETTSILIFDKGGKFHAKIEGKKFTPQHPGFFNFNFDKKTNLIEIDYMFTYIYFFDLNGKLVNKIKHKDPEKEFYGTKIDLGGKYDAHYAYNPTIPFYSKDSIGGELTVFENGKLKRLYLPYRFGQKDDCDNRCQSSLSNTDFYPAYDSNVSAAYYVRNLDYNIYRITPDTLQVAYRFVFPLQKSLPPDFRTDSSFNRKQSQYLEDHKEVIQRIGNFYTKDDYVFFRTINNNYVWLSYLYNTKTQNLICINKIVSDSSSYFLPVTDAELGGLDFNNHGIINFDGQNFYTSYSSLALFAQAEATKNTPPGTLRILPPI